MFSSKCQSLTTYADAITSRTMAGPLHAYSSDMFNELPDLPMAEESFVSKGGTDLVDKILRPIIEKYQLQGKFVVGLLQRHFELDGSEKLVEFNNISLPWKVTSDEYSGGGIVPSAWAICKGGLLHTSSTIRPLDVTVISTSLQPKPLYTSSSRQPTTLISNKP